MAEEKPGFFKKMTAGFNEKTGLTKFKQKTKEVFSKTAKTKDEEFEKTQQHVSHAVHMVREQFQNVE